MISQPDPFSLRVPCNGRFLKKTIDYFRCMQHKQGTHQAHDTALHTICMLGFLNILNHSISVLCCPGDASWYEVRFTVMILQRCHHHLEQSQYCSYYWPMSNHTDHKWNENILFFISNGPWLLLAWSKSFFLQGNDMGRKRQLFFKLLLKLSWGCFITDTPMESLLSFTFFTCCKSEEYKKRKKLVKWSKKKKTAY